MIDDHQPEGATSDGRRRSGVLLFYAGVIVLIVGSFLAQILRGDCPVP